MKTRPVGEKFSIEKVKYIVVEDEQGIIGCIVCAFNSINCADIKLRKERGECLAMAREGSISTHYEYFNKPINLKP